MALIIYFVGFTGSVIFLFTIMRFCFSKSKNTTFVEIGICALHGGVGLVQMLSPIPNSLFVNLVRVLVTIYIILLQYEASKLKKLAVGLFVLALIAKVESLISLFVLGPVDWSDIPEFSLLVEIIFFVGILLSLFILKLAPFLRKDHQPRIVWASLIFLSLLIYLTHLTVLLLRLELRFHLGIMVPMFAFYITMIHILQKFSITYEQHLASALHSQEKEHYRQQNELMQASVDATRSLKHDLHLHLAALADQIDNAPKQAKEYINALITNYKATDLHSKTGNIAFDSIINYSLNNIENPDVKLAVDVKVLPDLAVEPTDVTIILGNLLTNAITAIEVVTNPFLTINVNYSKGRLLIKIANSFDGIVNYKGKSIISRHDVKNRGLGMQNVQMAVARYNGLMTVDHENNTFVVEIMMYV